MKHEDDGEAFAEGDVDLADLDEIELARIEALDVMMKRAADPEDPTPPIDILRTMYGDDLVVPE